jgi:hypothetical protein
MKSISDNKARRYYDELKAKIIRRGCQVYDNEKLERGYYAFFDPNDNSIRMRKSKSVFVDLIVLAHEFGHFLELDKYYKTYGKRSYNKLIYKRKTAGLDAVFSETSAWLYAEKELNKIDVYICLDYRFRKHRREFVACVVKEEMNK